jgi:hypothetical protein
MQKIFIEKCFLFTVGEEFMKYAVEMGSDVMIYIPSFIKTGSGIQTLMGGIHRQHGDRINLLLFFENKESRLEIHKSLHANEIAEKTLI